jgi:glycosyltransferase involved in cell wall biosynthesis
MVRKTVCLNMIVKDEAHVIRRCLDSARPLIDRWVIVDTGSSDGTQALIRECLKDIPGELHERPWKDFAHNRSEAITLARDGADYLLFIDADDIFEVPADFRMPELVAQAYDVAIDYGAMSYRRPALVSTGLPWRWEGVLHEYLECGEPFSRGMLDGVRMRILGGGGRSRIDEAQKYRQDAEILERALAGDPDNTRYTFYLAQSYRDCGELEKSLAIYERRTQMGGFLEEVFCSLLESARIRRNLGRDDGEVIHAFLKAYEYRPSRAEPLGELAMYCRLKGPRWPLCHLFAQRAIEISMPDDFLFVGRDWYEWRCRDEYSIAAYWVGDYEQSRLVCEQLLTGGKLPEEHRARVQENLRFARQKLGLPV